MSTCYNKDLLFIHIPKCAGTTLYHRWPKRGTERGWLLRVLKEKPSLVVTPVTPHSSTQLAKALSGLKRNVNSFEKIVAIIRNPYDQQVSSYHWREQQYGCRQPTFIEYIHSNDSKNVSQEQWVKYNSYYLCWITDKDGKIPNNLEIIRFESLATELPKAIAPWCKEEHVAEWYRNGGKAHIPKDNTSEHKPYWEYYDTPETAEAVERCFAWAFKYYYDKFVWVDGKPTVIQTTTTLEVGA